MRRPRRIAGAVVCILMTAEVSRAQPNCAGQTRTAGTQEVLVLDQSGGVLAKAKLNINIDGSGRAYNWDNAKALIHLCNAARVHPREGAPYHGSVDNATCTG